MEKLQVLNKELRKEARTALRDRWGDAILTTLVYTGLYITISLIPSWWATIAIHLLLALPLGYGLSIYFLALAQGDRAQMLVLFDGYKNYKPIFTTLLFRFLLNGMWTLLLIVPGIVKFYSYSLTSFILRDTNLKRMDAIERSMTMMDGNKMRLFLLDLSVIWLGLISVIMFGIGFFALIPYILTSRARFYEAVKAKYEANLI